MRKRQSFCWRQSNLSHSLRPCPVDDTYTRTSFISIAKIGLPKCTLTDVFPGCHCAYSLRANQSFSSGKPGHSPWRQRRPPYSTEDAASATTLARQLWEKKKLLDLVCHCTLTADNMKHTSSSTPTSSPFPCAEGRYFLRRSRRNGGRTGDTMVNLAAINGDEGSVVLGEGMVEGVEDLQCNYLGETNYNAGKMAAFAGGRKVLAGAVRHRAGFNCGELTVPACNDRTDRLRRELFLNLDVICRQLSKRRKLKINYLVFRCILDTFRKLTSCANLRISTPILQTRGSLAPLHRSRAPSFLFM
jgi:hypothetical protein